MRRGKEERHRSAKAGAQQKDGGMFGGCRVIELLKGDVVAEAYRPSDGKILCQLDNAGFEL